MIVQLLKAKPAPRPKRGKLTDEQRELFRLRYRMTRWAKRYWPEVLGQLGARHGT